MRAIRVRGKTSVLRFQPFFSLRSRLFVQILSRGVPLELHSVPGCGNFRWRGQ
jgi:hypothetical protein